MSVGSRLVELVKPVRAPKEPKRLRRSTKPIARKSRPRKRSKATVAGLKRQLWTLFAAYVKERDGRTCISCHSTDLDGQNRHAGHLVSRRVSSTLFDPANVHVQCGPCNVWKRGNVAAYTLAFLDRYGEAKFRALMARSRVMHQWKAPELRDLIAAIEKGGHEFEALYAERYS
jgi:5-methylcytosine-specific restriction endonuclease McrA